MGKTITEVLAYRELLLNLTATEIKLRYRGSFLGFLWTILNPLFYLLILAVVFTKIIRLQIPNYTIFLFAGLTSWTMIQQTITIATGSIVNNGHLIRKVYIPKILFPLSNVLARFVDHAILIAILVLFMIILGTPLTWNLLFLPAAVVLHFFFTFGVSLLFSVAQIRVRDVQQVLAIAFQALFYVTPILYNLDLLPPRWRPLFLLNPFYYFVETLRGPVYYGIFPPLDILGVTLGLTVAALALGLWIFRRNEKFFVFHLS